MKKTILLLILATAFLLSTAKADVPPKGKTMIYGVGLSSCGKWIKAKNDSSVFRAFGQSWAQGYLTGLADGETQSRLVLEIDADIFVIEALSDQEAMLAFLDNYCEKNPLKQFADAVRSLALELSYIPE